MPSLDPADRLLPLLRRRWSPRDFDPRAAIPEEDVAVLLEAARWAPSAGNSQPWAFHAVRRDGAGWPDLVSLIAGSARPWASRASLLVVNLCHTEVAETDWPYSEFSAYDLGQAVAHLTIQAHGMGWACRQFRAFDRAGIEALLGVPEHWEATTMTAVGRAAPGATRNPLSGAREASVGWPRE